MRNAIRAALLGAAATLVAVSTQAAAWDSPDHRIVGAIADFVLNARHPNTYARVKDLFATKDAGGNRLVRTLGQVAVFPDCANPHNVPFCGRTPSDEEKAYAAHNPTTETTTSPMSPCRFKRPAFVSRHCWARFSNPDGMSAA
jgi:hypothetical protein